MWILLIWGKRRFEKHLGFVADYCPVCRKVTSFSIHQQRLANHFWFIPLERGDVVGHTRICSGCQTESPASPAAYLALSFSQGKSLDELIAKTNPTVREANKERLALADQLAANVDGVDETTRHRMMMEAFSLAEPHFQVGYGHQGMRILTVSLRPLYPREEEIRACLQRYRETGSRMGARLRTEEIMELVYPESVTKDPNKFSY